MADDPFASTAWKAYAGRVRTELVPKLKSSAMTISLAPSDPSDVDIKFAVELGLSIMLDKPLVVVIDEDGVVPSKLAAIAEVIVRGDITTAATRERLQQAIEAIIPESDPTEEEQP